MNKWIKNHFTIKNRRQLALRIIEIAAIALVIAIFATKISGYTHNSVSPQSIVQSIKKSYEATAYNIGSLKYFGSCKNSDIKISVGQRYLCRIKTDSSVYQSIYDTTPRFPKTADSIYSTLDTWDQSTVDAIMNNTYSYTGFNKVTISESHIWSVDPYNNASWRANYYGLSSLTELVNAAKETHDQKYADKLVALIDSYADSGDASPFAWESNHTVAERTIVMERTWITLHSLNMLPISTSTSLLKLIQKQADYLTDEMHYDTSYSQGIDEAVALYTVGTEIPQIPNAKSYVSTAVLHLNNLITDSVNSDGTLVGRSPNEHFNTLAKFWDVYHFSKLYDKTLNQEYKERLESMIQYGIYILQPNGNTPVIGSAVSISIRNQDEFAQIANYNSSFKYAITNGKQGSRPHATNVQFKSTGQTILRSGWTSQNYTQQTQTIFNYSSTVGASSQLNSLSLNVYSGGTGLLVSPGASNATTDPAIADYVKSTASQNTVTVDNESQTQGSSLASDLITNSNYTSQSASNTLNSHVTHERQVVQIQDGIVVVIDKLKSNDNKQHTFEQKFNFAAGLSYSENGATVTAQGQSPQQRVAITQLEKNTSISRSFNQSSLTATNGVCIYKKVAVGCNQVDATQSGKTALFATVIEVGKKDNKLTYSLDGSNIIIAKNDKTYTINIAETTGKNISATATSTKVPQAIETSIDSLDTPSNWSVVDGTLTKADDSYTSNKSSLSLTGSHAIATKNVHLDLASSDLLLRMKMKDTKNISNVSIKLYSGSGSAQLNLMNAYQSLTDSDPIGNLSTDTTAVDQQSNLGWSTISLAKGSNRSEQGQWILKGSGFDWSSINQIEFSVESSDGSIKQVQFAQLSATPEQKKSTVGIIFDDGSASILPATQYMNAHNIKGSVAVIGKYVEQQTKGYLSLSQLKTLQSQNWSLVNHSYDHQDAVSEYYNQNNLEGFKSDLLEGALFLQKNGISTDPNWYVYPHGTTNPSIEAVVGQYYKFARSEHRAPEGFPFGSPLAVKDFVVDDTTSVEAIKSAIDDANEYHQTLLLTFHRIHTATTDKSGYDYSEFKQVIDYIANTKANALSLNAIDAENGVPDNKITVTPATGDQLSGTVSVKNKNILAVIFQFFKKIFLGFLVTNVSAEPVSSKLSKTSPIASNYNDVIFSDPFNDRDGIISNEFSYWHANKACPYSSPLWNITSGTLFAKNGVGYSGNPTKQTSSICNSNIATNSAVFTMDTKQNDFENVKISLDYKLGAHSISTDTGNSYDGLHLLLGEKDTQNTYTVSLFRWDSVAVIKKKVAGNYFNLANEKTTQSNSLNTWHHADIYFTTNDTSVKIEENIDGNTTVSSIDKNSYGESYKNGAVGIQGNNTEFYIKNFTIAQ